MHEKETEGFLWLYADRQTEPTEESYQSVDNSRYSPTHRIIVQYVDPSKDHLVRSLWQN